jgi:hypothetical protein
VFGRSRSPHRWLGAAVLPGANKQARYALVLELVVCQGD